jgi:hypothetical protein
MAMAALKHLGKQEEADRENLTVDKLVQSIMGAGDGKTAGAAWFTVTTSEEYFVIRLLGLRPKSQALVTEGTPLVRQNDSHRRRRQRGDSLVQHRHRY